MCFVSVMLVPIGYYLVIPLWLTKSWVPRVQFWVGLSMYTFGGPFLNIAVLLYASFYMDSFGWGKTRKVISEDDTTTEPEAELQSKEKRVMETSKSSYYPASASDPAGYQVPSKICPAKGYVDEEKMIGR
jgi:chitin synthase